MPELPASEVDHLLALPRSERTARLRLLYAVGWPLSSLSLPLSLPRSTLYSHLAAPAPSRPRPSPSPPSPPLPLPPPPPSLSSLSARPARLTPRVPPDVAAELRTLAPLAARYRPAHAHVPDHPSLLARTRFDQLVASQRTRGVPASELARAAHVSHRTVARPRTTPPTPNPAP